MSVKANILRDAFGNITIQMEGDLAFEHSMPLRKQINSIVEDNPSTKVTVDMAGVDFVGSSGICHFMETITLINGAREEYERIKVENLSSDFMKILRLFSKEEANLIAEFFDMNSDETEELNSRFGNRKHTFEN